MQTFNLDEMPITHNLMFGLVFKEKALCKEMLERLLGIKIERLEDPKYEVTVIPGLPHHFVRYDVFVRELDGSERVFDVELQMTNKPDLALRSRYYQSAADVALLESGQKYTDLKELYIIFLCNGDFIKHGAAISHCETMFSDTKTPLHDRVHKFGASAYGYGSIMPK